MSRVPVAGPWITRREIDYVTDAVTNAWYGAHGRYHERFEAAFAEYVGRRYAISLPSCTSGLHLALAALGIGPGDEVIVPDVTWIASAAPVTYVGATTVFADIERDSWCLDPESFKARITPRTKAVIPVNLYGNMPDWDRLLAVAEAHNVAVIEDAAESVGSEYRHKKAGSFGLASAFSFHGSKTLTTGEGGMLTTDDDALYQRSMCLRDHGREPGDRCFRNVQVAYKYKMSSMQAALGLAQLERVEELVAKKRRIFHWYAEGLGDHPQLRLNSEGERVKNSYWMVTILVEPARALDKEALMDALEQRGIDSRPFFHPLSALPAYAGLATARDAREMNPVSYELSPWGVNLPSALTLTRNDVRSVCAAVKEILD